MLKMRNMDEIDKENVSPVFAGCCSLAEIQQALENSRPPFIHSTQAPSQDFNIRRKRNLKFHLYTLFLFTKSDFKTVVFPQSIFAIAVALSGVAASPEARSATDVWAVLSRVPHMVFWIWVHLLLEDLANQRQPQSISEDAVNKPWRPLPSGRISQTESLTLLQAGVPTLALVSLSLGAFTPSAAFMTLVWLYNDLEGSSTGPILRNVVNAAGLCCLGWGGHTVLRGKDSGQQITWSQDWRLYWMLMTAAAIATTVHAQDMPDMKGDLARQRKTFPLLYGERLARWSLAVLVVLWSVILPVSCNVQNFTARLLSLGVGSSISVLTMLYQHEPSDKLVWNLWCFWLGGLYLLPLFRQ